MAVECFSILSVTDVLCENLSAEDEVRLYGTCSSIYHGNKVHRDWLLNFRNYIHGYNATPALPKRNSQGSHEDPQVEPKAPPPLRVSLETIAEHDSSMGNDKRKLKDMPGETIDQKWYHYIHRKPLNGYENDPIFSNNEATSSKDRGNPQGSI